MGDGYNTKEEGIAAALADGFSALEDGAEGFSIYVCVCGRQDLYDNPRRDSIMGACSQCEVTIVPGAGHA